MGDLLDKVYKGSYNAFNIVLRKDIPTYNGILSENLSSGAITEVKVQYDTGLTCNLFANTGFLVLINEKNESETIPYLSYNYDTESGIITFVTIANIGADYLACLTDIVIDYGRIDCSSISVVLFIKKEIDGNVILAKGATPTNPTAGEFELILTTAETDIEAGKYFYTIAEFVGSEIMPFENSTLEIITDCIN